MLIDEETSLFSIAGFLSEQPTFYRPEGKLFHFLVGLIPDLGGNHPTRANFIRLRDALLAKGPARVLVVGGSVLGSGMDVLLTSGIELVETDIVAGGRTKLIVDAHSMPFADGSFDAVVAQAVLEHVIDPPQCVAEMHRVLKPDGLIYAETPFMQQVHGGAFDFQRFSHLGYLRLFRNFSRIESGAVAGTGIALLWAWEYFLLSLVRSRPSRFLARLVARYSSYPLRLIDPLFLRRDATLDGASGFFFYGAKSSRMLPDRELLTMYRGG